VSRARAQGRLEIAMNVFWLYPLILAAGALQAWGPPMNGALRISLTNPWLASVVSISLLNRDGDRLHTIYVGSAPESGKKTFRPPDL